MCAFHTTRKHAVLYVVMVLHKRQLELHHLENRPNFLPPRKKEGEKASDRVKPGNRKKWIKQATHVTA